MFETKSGVIKPIVYVGIINDHKLLLVNYKQAPNPTKLGWWIPAPGLAFGQDPKEVAELTAKEFGFDGKQANLFDVESFVTPGGWHLICHYLVNTNLQPKPHPNINEYKWVTQEELIQMSNIAHGKWEIRIGSSYLSR